MWAKGRSYIVIMLLLAWGGLAHAQEEAKVEDYSYISLAGPSCFRKGPCPTYNVRITDANEMVFEANKSSHSRTIGTVKRDLPAGSFTTLKTKFEQAQIKGFPDHIQSSNQDVCPLTLEAAQDDGYQFRPRTIIQLGNDQDVVFKTTFNWHCGYSGELDDLEAAILDFETLIDLNDLLYWPDFIDAEAPSYSLRRLALESEYKNEAAMVEGCGRIFSNPTDKDDIRKISRICHTLYVYGHPLGKYGSGYKYENEHGGTLGSGSYNIFNLRGDYLHSEYEGYEPAVDAMNRLDGVCEASCDASAYDPSEARYYRYGELVVFERNGVSGAAFEMCRRIANGFAPGRRLPELVTLCEKAFAGGDYRAAFLLSEIYAEKDVSPDDTENSAPQPEGGTLPVDLVLTETWGEKALAVLQEQAALNRPEAVLDLAELSNGQEDTETVRALYKRASDLLEGRTSTQDRINWHQAQLNLSSSEEQSLAVLKSLQDFALEGPLAAQATMADVYLNGRPFISKNKELAQSWSQKADQAGAVKMRDQYENLFWGTTKVTPDNPPNNPDPFDREGLAYLDIHQPDCVRIHHVPTYSDCAIFSFRIFEDDHYAFAGHTRTRHRGTEEGKLKLGGFKRLRTLVEDIPIDTALCASTYPSSNNQMKFSLSDVPKPEEYRESYETEKTLLVITPECLVQDSDGADWESRNKAKKAWDWIQDKAWEVLPRELVYYPEYDINQVRDYDADQLSHYAQTRNILAVNQEYCHRLVEDPDKIYDGNWEYFEREKLEKSARRYCYNASRMGNVSANYMSGRLGELDLAELTPGTEEYGRLQKRTSRHYQRAAYYGHPDAMKALKRLSAEACSHEGCSTLPPFDPNKVSTYSYADLLAYGDKGEATALGAMCLRRSNKWLYPATDKALLEICSRAHEAGAIRAAQVLARRFERKKTYGERDPETGFRARIKGQWETAYETRLDEKMKEKNLQALFFLIDLKRKNRTDDWTNLRDELAEIAIPLAEAGDPNAKYYLGRTYMNLYGDVPERGAFKAKGLKLLDESASAGHFGAKSTLASALFDEHDRDLRNRNKALNILKGASEAGDMSALQTWHVLQNELMRHL